MAITLTSLPLAWVAQPTLMDYGVNQTGAMGGVQQRGIRLGSRWAVKFSSLAGLSYAQAQPLIAARLKASVTGSTLITSWPQVAFATAIGAPVVDGAGQGGGTLSVRGLTPSIASLVAGLFFSVVVAGRSYLYQLADPAAVDGTGRAVLSIAPWLRAAPADGALLAFAAPNVEGFLDAGGVDWTLDRLAWVGLPAFTIQELQ